MWFTISTLGKITKSCLKTNFTSFIYVANRDFALHFGKFSNTNSIKEHGSLIAV